MIMHISDAEGGSLTLSALSRLVGLEMEQSRRKMAYWVSKRVVRVESVDDSSSGGDGDVNFRVIEDQQENAARDEEEEGQGADDADENSDMEQVPLTSRYINTAAYYLSMIFFAFSGPCISRRSCVEGGCQGVSSLY